MREPHPALGQTTNEALPATPARVTAPPIEETLVPFNARIPVELRRRYRLLAADTGRSIQALATDALTEYADRQAGQNR